MRPGNTNPHTNEPCDVLGRPVVKNITEPRPLAARNPTKRVHGGLNQQYSVTGKVTEMAANTVKVRLRLKTLLEGKVLSFY